MTPIPWLEAAVQPVLIAVATVAVLALLRLITPSVRWSRRLKHDGEILGALPDGREKDLWAASVDAQAERLRLYREDLSIADQVAAWYAFFVVVTGPPALISDAINGWPGAGELTKGDPVLTILGSILLAMNLAFAVLVTVRLILGRSTALHAGTGGHYPKYDALRRAERRRKAKRSRVEVRLAQLRESERKHAEPHAKSPAEVPLVDEALADPKSAAGPRGPSQREGAARGGQGASPRPKGRRRP